MDNSGKFQIRQRKHGVSRETYFAGRCSTACLLSGTPHPILEICRDELGDFRPPAGRSRRVPEDLQQEINRPEIGIFSPRRRESFALPRLPSDSRPISRAFRATGTFTKTAVFSSHLDILISLE